MALGQDRRAMGALLAFPFRVDRRAVELRHSLCGVFWLGGQVKEYSVCVRPLRVSVYVADWSGKASWGINYRIVVVLRALSYLYLFMVWHSRALFDIFAIC